MTPAVIVFWVVPVVTACPAPAPYVEAEKVCYRNEERFKYFPGPLAMERAKLFTKENPGVHFEYYIEDHRGAKQ